MDDELANIDTRRDEREAQGPQGSSLYHDPPDFSQGYQPGSDNFQPYSPDPDPQGQLGMSPPGNSGGQDFANPMQQSMGDELRDVDSMRAYQDDPGMQGGASAQNNPADMQGNTPAQDSPDMQGGASGQDGQSSGKPSGKQSGRKRPNLRGRGTGRRPRRPTERQLNKALATGNFSGLDLRGDFSGYRSLDHLRGPDGRITARELVSPDALQKHQMHMHGLNQPAQNASQRQRDQHAAQVNQINQSIQRRGINLSNTHLGGVDLSNTNLDRNRVPVNLAGANLEKANLKGANLSGQSLENSNLQGANLSKAKLDQAEMKGANLQGARVLGANLNSAKNVSRSTPGKNRSLSR